MNKFRLTIKKESNAAGGQFFRNVVIPYGWTPLKNLTINWVLKPVAALGVGTTAYNYFIAPDPEEAQTNQSGLSAEEIEEVNEKFKNIAENVFSVEYLNNSKTFYEEYNINSEIINYSMEKAMGNNPSLDGINISFTRFMSDKIDEFVERNMAGSLNLSFNEAQKNLYNERLRAFGEKIKDCLKSGMFKRHLEEELNDSGGPVDVFDQIYKANPESFEEIDAQARVIDEDEPEDKEEDRMSTYEKNRLEAKKFLEELEEDRKRREAEMGLLDATRPSDTRLDGSRIADNLNWYIRLEQKIEDEGSGLFGMYNKFKKLPIFSFVRAQSRGGEFTKDSRQVKRRYSSILMSKSDSKYRTEIFEAPEYDVYPYYIKQRILILKFLKNELGSKFDSIYNQKMDEIESSNYADDGEFSIMPNKLAKALNKIIKSAAVTEDYVANANKFLTYFDNLINKKFQSVEDAAAALGELKGFTQQKWGGNAFGTSGKKIEVEYNSNSTEYDNVMAIFKSVFEKQFESKVPFGSFVKFITGTSSYDEADSNDEVVEKLLQVLSKIKGLLGTENVRAIKDLSDNPVIAESPGNPRAVTEEPIDTIDENYNIMALRKAMTMPDYVDKSVRKTPEYSNLQNLGVVKIDEKYFVSKWNGSKEVFRYEQVKKDGEKYNLMTGGLYYYWVGNVKIRENGQETTKNVFMTNATVGDNKIEVETDNDLPGRASSRTISGIFINTSEMLDAKSDGSDNKRTALESYRYGNKAYSALTDRLVDLLNDPTVLNIRYPLTKAGAVLVNGRPSTISETDSIVLNNEEVSVQKGYLFQANTRYTLTGNPFSRTVNFVTRKGWSLSSKEETENNFLEEINKYLAQSSSGHFANPAILYYLNSQETSLYLKHLALYGFASINQGYLIPREEAKKMRARLSEELGKFYKKAKQSSSK